jgi:hypothetical protein
MFIMATLDGIIEPIYFLITSISFILLTVIQYKNFGFAKQFPHPLDSKNVKNKIDVLLPKSWYED